MSGGVTLLREESTQKSISKYKYSKSCLGSENLVSGPDPPACHVRFGGQYDLGCNIQYATNSPDK
jgi:hypothetical protein